MDRNLWIDVVPRDIDRDLMKLRRASIGRDSEIDHSPEELFSIKFSIYRVLLRIV